MPVESATLEAAAPAPVRTPYRKRPIRFVELLRKDGWVVKVYAISAKNELPPASMIEQAKALALAELPQPAVAEDRHGAAFVIAHEGADGNYLLLDWWVGGNMLKQRVYQAPIADTSTFTEFTSSGIIACVWELHLMAHERAAWIEHIMCKPGAPDFEAYYASHLNTDV
jgi:hypothetical protein